MIIIQKFGFKAKNASYYENILEIYTKNYKYNLKNFIEQTENKISIIYTFSHINDSLFENNDKEIKNIFFKELINKKSIKEINISDINSINILDKNIINFMTEKKDNLCVIRFREEDLIKLDDVHNLINDYISKESNLNLIQKEEDDEKKSKLFIILIHLSRVNEVLIHKNVMNNSIKLNNNNNNNNNNYYISFLSQTSQYFIDNINNKYSNFLDILQYSNEDIISYILKKENILSKEFCYSLRYFIYDIINKKQLIIKDNNVINNNQTPNIFTNDKIIEKEKEYEIERICLKKYKDTLIYKVVLDNNLKNFIINGIVSLFKKEEDLLKIIFTKNIINKEDDDYLETLHIYLVQQVRIYILKLIYLFDQKQIFQCFILPNYKLTKIINEEINNYIDNIYNINTNKLNLDGINLNNKIETKIIFGLKIPFIQNIISENILKFISKNIKENYIEKEKLIMNKKIPNENLDKEKERYIDEINDLNKMLKNELNNYPFIIKILKSGDIQLIKNLFNDCFHIFLMKSNIFTDDYDSLIEILDIIIQIRLKTRINNDLNIDFCIDANKDKIDLSPTFLDIYNNNMDAHNENKLNDLNEDKKENFYLDIFVNVLNFIESYSKEIYDILELFYFVNKDISGEHNCLNKIKQLIIEKKLTMENSERNPEYSQINKICFFLL